MQYSKSAYLLNTRHILKKGSVFKIRELADSSLLFGLPNQNCIIRMDGNLNHIQYVYDFDESQPLAIEVVTLGGR